MAPAGGPGPWSADAPPLARAADRLASCSLVLLLRRLRRPGSMPTRRASAARAIPGAATRRATDLQGHARRRRTRTGASGADRLPGASEPGRPARTALRRLPLRRRRPVARAPELVAWPRRRGRWPRRSSISCAASISPTPEALDGSRASGRLRGSAGGAAPGSPTRVQQLVWRPAPGRRLRPAGGRLFPHLRPRRTHRLRLRRAGGARRLRALLVGASPGALVGSRRTAGRARRWPSLLALFAAALHGVVAGPPRRRAARRREPACRC